MLAVIDMQNQILDPNSEFYIPGSDLLVHRIAQRIEQARSAGEYILYTRDIPIEYKNTEMEEQFSLDLIAEIKPRVTDHVFKKYYFGLSPEVLLEIQNDLKSKKKERENIEVVGVETSVCVLANTLKLQSSFPEANITIQATLTAGRERTEEALEILKGFNIEIL